MHIFGDSACFDRSVGLQLAQDILAVAVDGMDADGEQYGYLFAHFAGTD